MDPNEFSPNLEKFKFFGKKVGKELFEEHLKFPYPPPKLDQNYDSG
jgi:hypothetical protein